MVQSKEWKELNTMIVVQKETAEYLKRLKGYFGVRSSDAAVRALVSKLLVNEPEAGKVLYKQETPVSVGMPVNDAATSEVSVDDSMP